MGGAPASAFCGALKPSMVGAQITPKKEAKTFFCCCKEVQAYKTWEEVMIIGGTSSMLLKTKNCTYSLSLALLS